MSTKENLGILAAVIGGVFVLGAATIQAMGPGLFGSKQETPTEQDVPKAEPAPMTEPGIQPDTRDGTPDNSPAEPPPSGPMADLPADPLVVPKSAPAPAPVPPAVTVTPQQVVPPAKSEPVAPPVSAPVVSRKPTMVAGEGVASVKRENIGSGGNVRTQLVIDVVIENLSSEPIKFVVLSDETSLMLDGRTKFKISEVSTQYCSSSGSSCRRTAYNRYSELGPGETRSVTVTMWGDITPASRNALPDTAKASFTLGLSVIYNEGVDETVRLTAPSLNVDAGAVN